MNDSNFSGMLQMLMDTDLDTTQQDYVRTAQASGKALVSLINEVLDQAKIESGKLELETVPFDLRSVCDDILSLFCGKAQEKGLEVIKSISMLSCTAVLLYFFIMALTLYLLFFTMAYDGSSWQCMFLIKFQKH
jgi:signal transduction histidine kinase